MEILLGQELCVMDIANDASGTRTKGNYILSSWKATPKRHTSYQAQSTESQVGWIS